MTLASLTSINQDRQVTHENEQLVPGEVVSSIELTCPSGKTVVVGVSNDDYDKIAAAIAGMELEDFKKLSLKDHLHSLVVS